MVRKDVEQNILYVAHGYDPATAYRSDFRVHDFHFLTVRELPQQITFKIRHTPEWHHATVETVDGQTYMIHSQDAICEALYECFAASVVNSSLTAVCLFSSCL